MFLMALLFVIDDVLPYLEFSERAYGRFWDRSGLVLTHIAGGTLAVLIGPFQFWSGLRRWHAVTHRWTGRLYIAGVVLGGVTALQLSFHTQYWTFGVALFVGSVVWLASTGLSLAAARKHHFELHRSWAVRSYILTFTFVSFRLILEIPAVAEFGTVAEISTTVGWLCWTVPLLGYELLRQRAATRAADEVAETQNSLSPGDTPQPTLRGGSSGPSTTS